MPFNMVLSMKKYLLIASFLAIGFGSGFNAQATKSVAQNNAQLISADALVGLWDVADVDGEMFVNVDPKVGEMQVPMMLWIGKTFGFSKGQRFVIRDGNQTFFEGHYSLNKDKLTIIAKNEKFTMQVLKQGQNLQLVQTPEAFYQILMGKSKAPIEEIKKKFRVPKNIVFICTKK